MPRSCAALGTCKTTSPDCLSRTLYTSVLLVGLSKTTLTSCSGINWGMRLFLGLAISARALLPTDLFPKSALRADGTARRLMSGVGRAIPAVLPCTGSTLITHQYRQDTIGI